MPTTPLNTNVQPKMQPGNTGHLPPATTTDGKAALDAIWEKKWASARKQTKHIRIFGLLCFMASPVCVYIFGPHAWTFGIFMGAVLMGDVARVDGLTEQEYYSVPGSRNETGEHRCIYCGNQGIETHYYGRSGTLKEIRCHACQTRLF